MNAMSFENQYYSDGDNITCPICNSQRSRVVGSRPHRHTVRRRRQCKNCKSRFWTMEVHCDIHCEPLGLTDEEKQEPVT